MQIHACTRRKIGELENFKGLRTPANMSLGAQNLKPIVLIRCEPVAGNPIFIFVLDFLLVFLFCRRALSIRIESES